MPACVKTWCFSSLLFIMAPSCLLLLWIWPTEAVFGWDFPWAIWKHFPIMMLCVKKNVGNEATSLPECASPGLQSPPGSLGLTLPSRHSYLPQVSRWRRPGQGDAVGTALLARKCMRLLLGPVSILQGGRFKVEEPGAKTFAVRNIRN